MADVELDAEIVSKLSNRFDVSKDDIFGILDFFNSRLKPAIKVHYLSHLISRIEEMINDSEKEKFIVLIKNSAEESGKDMDHLLDIIREKRIRLFTINLKPLIGVRQKAKLYNKSGGVLIFYADYLTENEKRFAIAHELGHVVLHYLLKDKVKLDNNNRENLASLFAYIALLDKNNFYQSECKNYILDNDFQLLNEYLNLIHNKKFD